MSQSPGENAWNTPRKQAGFRMIFRQNLRMTRNWPGIYFAFDGNAGPGWLAKANCAGSPLGFLDEAAKIGRPVNALFCDSNQETLESCRAASYGFVERLTDSTTRFMCADNALALDAFSDWIMEEAGPDAYGHWLFDPNGMTGLPLEKIKEFCVRHRRIDAVLSLNVSLFARVRGCRGRVTKTGTPWGFDDWPDLADVLGLRPYKTHWLVRNPNRGGRGENFILFLGRNTDMGMSRFEEFYPLESENGQEIVNGLRRIRTGQLRFWEDYP